MAEARPLAACPCPRRARPASPSRWWTSTGEPGWRRTLQTAGAAAATQPPPPPPTRRRQDGQSVALLRSRWPLHCQPTACAAAAAAEPAPARWPPLAAGWVRSWGVARLGRCGLPCPPSIPQLGHRRRLSAASQPPPPPPCTHVPPGVPPRPPAGVSGAGHPHRRACGHQAAVAGTHPGGELAGAERCRQVLGADRRGADPLPLAAILPTSCVYPVCVPVPCSPSRVSLSRVCPCVPPCVTPQGIMNEVELLKNLNHRNIVKCAGRPPPPPPPVDAAWRSACAHAPTHPRTHPCPVAGMWGPSRPRPTCTSSWSSWRTAPSGALCCVAALPPARAALCPRIVHVPSRPRPAARRLCSPPCSSVIKQSKFGPFPESLVAVYIQQVLQARGRRAGRRAGWAGRREGAPQPGHPFPARL